VTADLFRTMLTIRLVEERLQAMCMRGEAGDLHFSRGQEAIATGVCAALRPTDHIVTHHRTIAHEIAKIHAMFIGPSEYANAISRSKYLYGLIAEILGKRTGVNGGVAGEMHISNPAIRHDFSFQLVGTCVPVAVGIAYAQKYFHKNDEIVAVFFGDAASSNGQVHEALTIAAIHKVPLLLVCENNGLAGNVTKDHYLPTKTVGERMAAYGIPYATINGNDVESVRGNAMLASAWIRDGGGPMMLECMTHRCCHHKQGQGDIRGKEAVEKLLAEVDPLLRFPVMARASLEHEINRELDEVFARVAKDPLPEVRLDG
jgi:acetoin:2,6-dichlorophenolindophenol oxidoreductase subunit alpha